MRAAIYARRSKEEHQEASLVIQVGEARSYITKKGWLIDDEDIYCDDGISRAEFKHRPQLTRLLGRVEGGEIDVIVVRDETRIGGNMVLTGVIMQQIHDQGVQLYYYYTDEQVRMETAYDKLLITVRNFTSEIEREKISQRTHEHLLFKARRGLNAGGKTFGYDNVRNGANEVEFRINETEAEVVREIFQRYANGDGLRTVATALNNRGVRPPRANSNGTGSWSPSCIRAFLRREHYVGRRVWNKQEKKYRGGTKVRELRAEDEWVTVDVPKQRIVEEDLWLRVQERFASNARGGKPTAGRRPKYLLSGIVRCEECGGPLKVSSRKWGRVQTKVYSCAYHRDRGASVCGNAAARPVDEVNKSVIAWIKENVLTDDIVKEVIASLRKQIEDRVNSGTGDLKDLEASATNLEREIGRFVTALATTDSKPEAIMQAISEREARLRVLRGEIEAMKAGPKVIHLESKRLEKEATARLTEFTELLGENQLEARRVVQAIVEGQLTVTPVDTPEGSRFQIEGETTFGCLFTNVASPRGFCTLVNGPRMKLMA